MQPSVEKDLAAWQRVMDVNVRDVFTCCRRVGREMLAARAGRVVNIAARSGYDVEALRRRVPAGRLAQPDDVARAVAYLASPESDYVNGVTLVVDGGLTASHGIPL